MRVLLLAAALFSTAPSAPSLAQQSNCSNQCGCAQNGCFYVMVDGRCVQVCR